MTDDIGKNFPFDPETAKRVIEESTLSEILRTTLPPEPTYFELYIVNEVTSYWDLETGIGLFEKHEAYFMATVLLMMLGKITTPSSIDEFELRRQALTEYLIEYTRIESGNSLEYNKIDTFNKLLVVLLEKYGILSREEILICQTVNPEADFLFNPHRKLNEGYINSEDKKIDIEAAATEIATSRRYGITTGISFGKYRMPGPGHGKFLEKCRHIAQVIFVGAQTKNSIEISNPDKNLYSLADDDKVDLLTIFEPVDRVFLTDPPSLEEFPIYFGGLRQKLRPHFVFIGGKNHYAREALLKEAGKNGFILLWNEDIDPSKTTSIMKDINESFKTALLTFLDSHLKT